MSEGRGNPCSRLAADTILACPRVLIEMEDDSGSHIASQVLSMLLLERLCVVESAAMI